MYKKILIPLENSAADRAILQHIKPLAKLTRSGLLLMHVADGWVARNYEQLNLAESEEMKTVNSKKCQRGESNPRPRAYESPALPLSYPGYYAENTQLIFDTLREIE